MPTWGYRISEGVQITEVLHFPSCFKVCHNKTTSLYYYFHNNHQYCSYKCIRPSVKSENTPSAFCQLSQHLRILTDPTSCTCITWVCECLRCRKTLSRYLRLHISDRKTWGRCSIHNPSDLFQDRIYTQFKSHPILVNPYQLLHYVHSSSVHVCR